MHLSWTHSGRDKVAFSDESSFTVKPASLRKRVWRKEGGRYRTVNIVPMFKPGYVCISVWAIFSVHGRTPLIRINGNMNQEKYKNVYNLICFLSFIIFMVDFRSLHSNRTTAEHIKLSLYGLTWMQLVLVSWNGLHRVQT